MEKPFDFKVLAAKLKEKGLIHAEDAAESVAKEVFAWTKESAALHSNPLVKSLVPVLITSVEPIAFEAIDKIDGQVG